MRACLDGHAGGMGITSMVGAMTEGERTAAQFAADVKAIDQRLEKFQSDNRKMLSLLSQAALFIACQPENRFRAKWLQEVQELIDG